MFTLKRVILNCEMWINKLLTTTYLPANQLFKLNKFGLSKKVIDGKAPEYLIATLDSLRFE